MTKSINEDTKVKRYKVDIYADGSDIEIMTRKELIDFATEQVFEWYDEIKLQVLDENGNLESEEYAEGNRLVDKIVDEEDSIQSISEVEELFKLPAITIPFEEIYI